LLTANIEKGETLSLHMLGRTAGRDCPDRILRHYKTDAKELASKAYDWMPAILNAADYETWLACGAVPLVHFASDRMKARTVNR